MTQNDFFFLSIIQTKALSAENAKLLEQLNTEKSGKKESENQLK